MALLICLPWTIGVLAVRHGGCSPSSASRPRPRVPPPGAPCSDSPSGRSAARRWPGGSWSPRPAPLLLARGVRFRWAARFWAVALVFWFAAWVIGPGLDRRTGDRPPGPPRPGGRGHGGLDRPRRGRVRARPAARPSSAGASWSTVVGVLAVALASLPDPGLRAARSVGPADQRLRPVGGLDARQARRTAPSGSCGSPIPRSLNQGSWNAGDGLAYATSEDGPPDARWLWNGTGAGPAAELGTAVDLARPGPDRPTRQPGGAGRRPLRRRADRRSPRRSPASRARRPTRCPPTCCPPWAASSTSQPVLSGTGITVFANADWVPQRAEVPGRPGAAARARPRRSPDRARPSCPVRRPSCRDRPRPARSRARWRRARSSPRPPRRGRGT